MRLAEPATTLTDYALAALALTLALALRRSAAAAGARAPRLWAAAFVATGAAGLTGGTWHGFAPWLFVLARAALWRATYTLIGLAGFFMLAGAAASALPARWQRGVRAALLLRLALYLAVLWSRPDFRYVVYDHALTLVLLLGLSAHLLARREAAAPWLLAGVLTSLGGAALQRSGFSLHRHLNHNDLFHIVQMAGLWLYFQAGRRLRDAR